jgi:predicted ATPase
MTRREEFTFTRRDGRARRVTVSGNDVTILDDGQEQRSLSRRLATRQTTGLATLPKLSDADGGSGIRGFSQMLSSLRVIEPDVGMARMPSRSLNAPLAPDAGNLADALVHLRTGGEDAFNLLQDDLARCLPGLKSIQLVPVGGAARSVAVQLVESGVRMPIDLLDASFGTVRLLSLLVALHEPDPPLFTAVEEVDHGLHPYALDLLVDRMRAASRRTQILAATHSPTFVNRLEPEEIIVCDRDPRTGESLIPAISPEQIRASIQASDWRPGELWFAGVINGIPAV